MEGDPGGEAWCDLNRFGSLKRDSGDMLGCRIELSDNVRKPFKVHRWCILAHRLQGSGSALSEGSNVSSVASERSIEYLGVRGCLQIDAVLFRFLGTW